MYLLKKYEIKDPSSRLFNFLKKLSILNSELTLYLPWYEIDIGKSKIKVLGGF